MEAHQMTYRAVARFVACTATLCFAIMGPVAAASASSKSIKAVIVSYSPKVDIAEGHVVTAVGEYEASAEPKSPAGVEAAIANSVAVLSALKAKVADQPARKPRVKKARTKIVKGLQAVIVGYGDLSVAYEQKATNQEAATVEANKADALAAEGRKELQSGVKLLG
jgi:hypothetical protein